MTTLQLVSYLHRLGAGHFSYGPILQDNPFSVDSYDALVSGTSSSPGPFPNWLRGYSQSMTSVERSNHLRLKKDQNQRRPVDHLKVPLSPPFHGGLRRH